MPNFFAMLRTCPVSILEFHFQQLGILVSIVKQHIRNWLPDIFQLIHDFWSVNTSIQITIIALIESIALAMDGEFRIYVPTLLPQLLQVVDSDTTDRKQPTARVLHAVTVLGRNLEDSLHLVIPAVVRVVENRDVPIEVQKAAVQALSTLCRRVNLAEHAARIVHPLARVLPSADPAMRMQIMDCLTNLGYQMASDFLIFSKLLLKVGSQLRGRRASSENPRINSTYFVLQRNRKWRRTVLSTPSLRSWQSSYARVNH